ASFNSENSNEYPAVLSTTGFTRALASNNASAISPNARRTPKAGIGKNVGRESAYPSVLVNSALVTGFGATKFTGPETYGLPKTILNDPRTASKAIQLIHGFPLPIRPPAPNLNGGSIWANAPPCASRMMPNRVDTTRIPFSEAGLVAFSQSIHTCARKSDP